ncbi:outer membrane protein OmpK [Pseudomonas sp. NPDC078700]|uniref:outer membrane protein OmpK n=1 Tax=Pseudomonas sp. NPDC078700 TaxID=3364424 RepID=UPI0037C61E67
MKRTMTSLLLANGLLAAGQSLAGDLLQWQDNSLTYEYGNNFKVDPENQQIITFSHASGWSFGDLYLFVDGIKYNTNATNGNDDGHSFYGELSPRLSLGKISGTDLSFGPIKDVLIATTYEFGEGDKESYLIGPGFDLNIPGFNYFQLNTYYRESDGKRDGSGVWQITPAWSYTIPVGNSDLVIDGYIDWVPDNDKSYHANFHFNPQIKYDVAKAFGFGKKVYVGIEYDYWKNKYAIDNDGYVGSEVLGGTDQSVAMLMVRAHF